MRVCMVADFSIKSCQIMKLLNRGENLYTCPCIIVDFAFKQQQTKPGHASFYADAIRCG